MISSRTSASAQPLHGFQIERLCGDAVQFAQSLETGHHFVGFRRPAHLPRCRFADSLLNQAEARRCPSVSARPTSGRYAVRNRGNVSLRSVDKEALWVRVRSREASPFQPIQPVAAMFVPLPGARLGDQVVGRAPGRFERDGLFRLVVVGQQARAARTCGPRCPSRPDDSCRDRCRCSRRRFAWPSGTTDGPVRPFARCSALGAVAVAHHRGGEPLAPEFGTETPVAVGLVAERLHETLDILSHQPVIDAPGRAFRPDEPPIRTAP